MVIIRKGKNAKKESEKNKKSVKPKEGSAETLEMRIKENDPWKVLKYPQLAEKSINMVEIENKLVFIVNKKASKEKIKEAIEKQFNVRVIKVNVEVTRKGEKKAFIKLHPDDSAADIASRMGML
jgi:large subunit ribosomal protein L23